MYNQVFNTDYIYLDVDLKDQENVFKFIAEKAHQFGLITSKEALIKGFLDREEEGSTGFEDGFAIPHAHIKEIKKPAIIVVRSQEGINWESIDGQPIKVVIALLVPLEGKNDYLDTLSNVAIKLMDENFKKVLITSQDPLEIIEQLSKTNENNIDHLNLEKDKKTIVGISSCATGVAHTYMARTALIEAGQKLGWNVFIETQGQKGVENGLTQEQIEKADAVIIASDIGVELNRFNGKKVYSIGTKAALKDPEGELQKSLNQGQLLKYNKSNEQNNFEVKDKKKWVSHIMNGISYMIPFIVFAGLLSAIIGGIGYAAWGSNWTKDKPDSVLKTLNDFAGIGFTVMMGVAGGYIANSIAGRSAFTPAFILTMAGNNPKLVFQGYFKNVTVKNPFFGMAGNELEEMISLNQLMQPLNIIGAIIFGLSVGYFVRWINTKWKINKYIQPIMPIIIIPVFLSLTFWLVWMFTFGPLMGVVLGYFNFAIMKMEASGVGMIFVGLVLGLLAGVDMGGPINKISSFGATALIPIDNGIAMGCAAAAFGVAPIGIGVSTLIWRKRLNEDKALSINTTILGVMGISEGAIPFATKYGWKVFIPNIIASGVAGMFAGIFKVRGHVGAWGGPIIAIFAGVDTTSGSYVGIPLYLLAILIGVAVYIGIFRLLMNVNVDKTGKRTKLTWVRSTKNKEVVSDKELD